MSNNILTFAPWEVIMAHKHTFSYPTCTVYMKHSVGAHCLSPIYMHMHVYIGDQQCKCTLNGLYSIEEAIYFIIEMHEPLLQDVYTNMSSTALH